MNTDELVSNIRRIGQISLNDPVYTDAEILAEATQAMRERFASPIMLTRQGYWLKEAVVTTNGANDVYKIPAYTIVQGLEKVEIAEAGSDNYHELLILTQPQASAFTGLAKGKPTHFTLESDQVRLWPAPNTGFNLRMVFYLQPPELIPFSQAGKILATSFTAVAVDAAWPEPPEGYQFYVQNHDGTHEIPCFDATVDTVTPSFGPSWVLDVGGPIQGGSRIQVGDYVTPRGTSVFPMLPLELHRPLCDYVSGMIWISKGDKERAQILTTKGETGISRFIEMGVSRVKTKPFTWKRTNSFLRRHLGG